MKDTQIDIIMNNITVLDLAETFNINYNNHLIYEIYKDDGTIYCKLQDKNENTLDIPQWVFVIKDLLIK